MAKKIILCLAFMLGAANSAAPLLMLPMESDIDSGVAALWENSLMQILKEANFNPAAARQDFFEGCENVECAISKARASGAQGLFRGRMRKSGDSVSVRFHIDWLAGNSTPQTSASGMAPLSWDKAIKSGILLKLVYGITGKSAGEQNKDKATIVKVETSHDGAVVMLDGETVCLSPCDFSVGGNANPHISAYWHSGENLWAAKRAIRPGEDTVKVYLELKRSFAETDIFSVPEKALVFPEGVLELKSKPLGKTPYTLRGLPGENHVRIFREGFNDTLISVNIDAIEKQAFFVQLTPVRDQQKAFEQSLFLKSQSKRNIGLGLIAGSAGPLAAGIMLFNFAQNDYDKAKKLKSELEIPSFGGANYNAKISENHKAVKNGDSKAALGAGLAGLAALLAGIGISMSF